MARLDQDGARRMANYVFCGAAEQNMLQSCGSMRGRNDHVRAIIFSAYTNLIADMADL